jgi:hypothetical protein
MMRALQLLLKSQRRRKPEQSTNVVHLFFQVGPTNTCVQEILHSSGPGQTDACVLLYEGTWWWRCHGLM